MKSGGRRKTERGCGTEKDEPTVFLFVHTRLGWTINRRSARRGLVCRVRPSGSRVSVHVAVPALMLHQALDERECRPNVCSCARVPLFVTPDDGRSAQPSFGGERRASRLNRSTVC